MAKTHESLIDRLKRVKRQLEAGDPRAGGTVVGKVDPSLIPKVVNTGASQDPKMSAEEARQAIERKRKGLSGR